MEEDKCSECNQLYGLEEEVEALQYQFQEYDRIIRKHFDQSNFISDIMCAFIRNNEAHLEAKKEENKDNVFAILFREIEDIINERNKKKKEIRK